MVDASTHGCDEGDATCESDVHMTVAPTLLQTKSRTGQPDIPEPPEPAEGDGEEIVRQVLNEKAKAVLEWERSGKDFKDFRFNGSAVDLPALSLVRTNASHKSESDPVPIHENAYCYPRWDVAGFLGQGLSVNGCYFFSCWAYESTCGNYFYSNGNNYCKCCTYSASPTHRRRGWFVSSKGNDLYQCR